MLQLVSRVQQFRLSQFTVLPLSPMAVHAHRMAGPGLRPSLLETHSRIDKFQVIMSCQCMSTYMQSVMYQHYHTTSQPVALSPNQATMLQKYLALHPFRPQAMYD